MLPVLCGEQYLSNISGLRSPRYHSRENTAEIYLLRNHVNLLAKNNIAEYNKYIRVQISFSFFESIDVLSNNIFGYPY